MYAVQCSCRGYAPALTDWNALDCSARVQCTGVNIAHAADLPAAVGSAGLRAGHSTTIVGPYVWSPLPHLPSPYAQGTGGSHFPLGHAENIFDRSTYL